MDDLNYLDSSPLKLNQNETQPHAHLEGGKSFWIFGYCGINEYKHWLLGCRSCPEDCDKCTSRFIGVAKCSKCQTGVLQDNKICFYCPAGEFVKLNEENDNVCELCSKTTPHCKACKNKTGTCLEC